MYKIRYHRSRESLGNGFKLNRLMTSEPNPHAKEAANCLGIPPPQERGVVPSIEEQRSCTAKSERCQLQPLTPSQDARPSKIVATILSGNSESIIEPALQSVVDWVDEVCLIDTGITDDTVQRCRTIAREKLTLRSFPWCNDFAAARNEALRIALERGATWAMTLDTDERIEFPGYRSQVQLLKDLESSSEVVSWMLPAQDGSYVKERFVRIPTHLQWRGRTHEALFGATLAERKVLDGGSFWEAAKSPEEHDRKLQRDLVILLEETTASPRTARNWFYLGQTYEGLQQYRQAVEAFDRCIRLDDWADESSWACYMAARCLVALNEYREAEEYCALGMSRKPTMAELPWLAGWCCFQRGAITDAITWSQISIGLAQNTRARIEATFRYMPAWYEGPYDVLRYAYLRLDAPQLSRQAEVDYQNTQVARLKLVGHSAPRPT